MFNPTQWSGTYLVTLLPTSNGIDLQLDIPGKQFANPID
jgi:hypothetical protein